MSHQPSAESDQTPSPPVQGAIAEGTSRRVIVSVRDVVREYRVGGEVVRALNGVSLDIFAGEYLSIMGPSGSGKSTLFNMIGGLDTPTTGSVTVHGVKIAVLSRVEQSCLRNFALGYIFQSYNLIPVMTALQNVALPILLGGATVDDANKKAAELLEAVGLGHRLDHRPEQLSGGQQQRVAIARSFANDPAIILADEPTGNLDTRTGEAIIDQLSRLSRERGVTIISATHDHKMLSVSDRVVTIRDGKIAKIELRKDLQIKVGKISTGEDQHKADQTDRSRSGIKFVAKAKIEELHGDALVARLRANSTRLPFATLLALAMGGLKVRMTRSAVTMLSVVLAIAFLAYTGLSNNLLTNLAQAVKSYESFTSADPAKVAAATEKALAVDIVSAMPAEKQRQLARDLGLDTSAQAKSALISLPDAQRKSQTGLAAAKAALAKVQKDAHADPADIEGARKGVARAETELAAINTREEKLKAAVEFGQWLQTGQGPDLSPKLAQSLKDRYADLVGRVRSPGRLATPELKQVEEMIAMAAGQGGGESLVTLNEALAQERLKRSAAELRGLLRRAGVNASATLKGNPMDTWLIVMAMLTCAVGIANAMLMSVTERFREIGTMKCLGAQDGLVVELFLLESAFLGVFGALLGILLGVVVAVAAAFLQYGGYGLGNFPVMGAVKVVLLSVAVGVGLSVVGAVYPAYAASRMRPVDALRVEE